MYVPAQPTLAGALLASHEMDTEVDVFLGSTLLFNNLPIRGGSVSATLGTRTGRSATLLCERQFLSVLSPLGARVIIRTGIGTLEMVPIFEGRIDSVVDDPSGALEVQCSGRGQDVQDARFTSPFPVNPGTSMLGVLTGLLSGGSFGAGVVVDPDVQDATTTTLVYEEDRGEACDDLARTLQAIWSDGRAGAFRVFRNPFAQTVQPPVAAVLKDGVNNTLVNISRTTSRTLIANSVTVVVERTDGSAPVRASAQDMNPASPTYWLGPFGQQNRIVKSEAPLNLAAAQTLALRLLSQSLALSRTWSITLPHYPLLDPGDVIAVWWMNEVTAQVIESITYPVAASDAMSLTTREWRPLNADPNNLVF